MADKKMQRFQVLAKEWDGLVAGETYEHECFGKVRLIRLKNGNRLYVYIEDVGVDIYIIKKISPRWNYVRVDGTIGPAYYNLVLEFEKHLSVNDLSKMNLRSNTSGDR